MFWRHVARLGGIGAALAALVALSAPAAAQSNELTIWTMGGDQPGWIKWLDAISANFKKSNPGATVTLTVWGVVPPIGVALNHCVPSAVAVATANVRGPEVLETSNVW